MCILFRPRERYVHGAIYDNDILAISRNEGKTKTFEKFLSGKFEIKSLEGVNYCLGIGRSSKKNNDINKGQKRYIRSILEQFGMTDAKSVASPIELGIELRENEDLIKEANNWPYRKTYRPHLEVEVLKIQGCVESKLYYYNVPILCIYYV